MANFCHNCGHKVTAKQRYCSNCGEALIFDSQGKPVSSKSQGGEATDFSGWIVFYQIVLILNVLFGIYMFFIIDDVSYALSTMLVSIIALVLFIMLVNRSTHVPEMVIVYHVASFVASFLAGVETDDSSTVIITIFTSAVWGVIWINYFQKKKIKALFAGN